MLQGSVSDSIDGSELYIAADGNKEGYIFEKQDISTYGDVLVGCDNFFGDCYIVSYPWIWITPGGIALKYDNVRFIKFLSSDTVLLSYWEFADFIELD